MGATNLAAVGLANSIFNVSGAAVLFGLSIALDTLFAQVGSPYPPAKDWKHI